MTPYFEDSHVTIYHGDCREVLPELGVFKACITDPPYGLSFMGKDWDRGVPGPHFWEVIGDALLPGAPLLAFGGTRTFHRLTCAIEDAGFEIRDCLCWLYGSGFPKSLDISKAIDKAARRDYVDAAVSLGMEIPGNSLHDWTKGEHSPSDKWWETFKEHLSEREWGAIEREVVDKAYRVRRESVVRVAGLSEGEYAVTAPATPEAATWEGWGSALKPAWEPCILAMKPLDGTFAENALRHGVAGLNIDGARIGTDGGTKRSDQVAYPKNPDGTEDRTQSWARTGHGIVPTDSGRWPANVALDEEAARMLDEQSGERGGSAPASGPTLTGESGSVARGRFNGVPPTPYHGDTGGASRFFYTSKASRADRGEGNDHPTVKPTDLMEWLCKLTATPAGGTVLDPFMGSGTTLLAARNVGRKAVGIELEEAHCEIAARRLEQGVLAL